MRKPKKTVPAADSIPGAIEPEEANRLFSSLEGLQSVSLAVSGGPDSLALLFLYERWRRDHAPGQQCLVLTVDHGLRDQSAGEAKAVGDICRSLSLEHRILTWTGEKPTSDLQARARETRYDLMKTEMAIRGIKHLVLGHHLDDQAETFLGRLARGSGVYGLASMAPLQPREDIILLRPLLEVAKGRLITTVKGAGWQWSDDPSNRNPKYLRSRLRDIGPELERVGLTPERMAGTARRMQRAAKALQSATEQLGKTVLTRHPAGPACLKLDRFFDAPEEIGLRLLSQTLAAVGGRPYGPRLDHVEGLYESLRKLEAGAFRGASLAGVVCFVSKKDSDRVWFFRERREEIKPVNVHPGQTVLWDRRFNVKLSDTAPAAVEIDIIGSRSIEELQIERPDRWPRRIFETAPIVIWPERVETRDHYVPGLSERCPDWLAVEPAGSCVGVLPLN